MNPSPAQFSKKSAFALVTSLFLMSFLLLLAVALFSLAVVSIRSADIASARTEAQANAKMALMVALGKLQQYAGKDTRVTAPAMDPSSPPLTGVWRSWEGSDHPTDGVTDWDLWKEKGDNADADLIPFDPDYASKDKGSANGGRFLTWLVSGAEPEVDPQAPADLVSTTAAAGTIPLLSTGSLADGDDGDTRQVHVTPVSADDSGRFAWWVSGENQKALLQAPYKPAPDLPAADTAAAWSNLAKSHAVSDPAPFQLDTLLTDPSLLPKVSSREMADFLNPSADPSTSEYFHDLTTNSIGLLTNTATGGWRKDLSLMTENWDALPADGLPFFNFLPEISEDITWEKPTLENAKPYQYQLLPWVPIKGLHGGSIKGPIRDHADQVLSWQNLVEWATFYRNPDFQPGADGSQVIPIVWDDYPSLQYQMTWEKPQSRLYQYLHQIRPMPVIARVRWLFSHRSEEVNPDEPDPDNKEYRVQLLVTPVITLWNPYNISLSVPGFTIDLEKSPPSTFTYETPDGEFKGPFRLINDSPDNGSKPIASTNILKCHINQSFQLLPGETQVFSPETSVSSDTITMDPGLDIEQGFIFDVPELPDYKSADPIIVSLRFNRRAKITKYAEGSGPGISLKIRDGLKKKNLVRMLYQMSFQLTDPEIDLYWPPIESTELNQPEASAAAAFEKDGESFIIPIPFLSTIFGARVASDTNLPGKGFVQSNPLTAYSNASQGTVVNPGSDHPVNSSFDYSFIAHTDKDTLLPSADDFNRGFIVSGITPNDGLSRVIAAELPIRPIASLAELQNWDIRGLNFYPPFSFNMIGNSDATPLVAPDEVFRRGSAFDTSYAANHVLFDDWFVSSITPQPTAFGSAGLSMQEHYRNFLMGTEALTNRNYQPIEEDRNLSQAEANARVQEVLVDDAAESWQTIASRLEVRGMFNVNSTSVKAWRALLGHCRGLKVPYYDVSSTSQIKLSSETDHAFSRFSVAGDTEASSLSSTAGQFPDASEYTGYRVFTDAMIDELAEKVVEQVRLRGPFLSLSEFINRKLTSSSDEEELALAGALQTALNNMPTDPAQTLEVLSRDTSTDPPGEEMYDFPAAAAGYSSYGVPGWIRQADLLRPIAPILSARDDTFTIRAYGESRDSSGNVLGSAWCEATVVRSRDFVDPAADAADSIEPPLSPANVDFGRRFRVVSFRWLEPSDV